LLVGDEAEDLVLIDISGDKAKLNPLCYHGTSWYGQTTHCHPTFSWDSGKILFASERENSGHLYCVDV
jgi:oligogalacturonide lyase